MSESVKVWPLRIEVVGVTGEFESGKSLFLSTIWPGRGTLAYDMEKSLGSYESLGFERIDVPTEMNRLHPKGYRPIDTFKWWLAHVRSIPAGKYRVIIVDPASDIESGLADYVESNPTEFGRTSSQYQKMQGLKWGDVKEFWKMILADISSRCETFGFSTHMGNVWSGNTPTTRRKPKGKETLMELASLYLHMERKTDEKGHRPDVPAATVLKSRLAITRIDKDGNPEIMPCLPPRLPVATPQAIRQYMEKPPDYSKLKKGELAPEVHMTEEEKLAMSAQMAADNLEVERLRTDRLSKSAVATPAKVVEKKAETSVVAPPASGNGDEPKITDGQLAELRRYYEELKAKGLTDEVWKKKLSERGAKSAKELTFGNATQLISAMAHKLNVMGLEEAAAQQGGLKS